MVCIRGVPKWRPDLPLSKAVKVKPGLPQRRQNVGDARVLGNQLRRDTHRECNRPRGKEISVVKKIERI